LTPLKWFLLDQFPNNLSPLPLKAKPTSSTYQQANQSKNAKRRDFAERVGDSLA